VVLCAYIAESRILRDEVDRYLVVRWLPNPNWVLAQAVDELSVTLLSFHENGGENVIRIERAGLRVEFDGADPARVVVPIIFPVGKYRDVHVRVSPRSDVALSNAAEVGDALQSTFSRSHTTTAGASFFASASHGRTFGSTQKPYDVVHLPDFRGVRFRLSHLDVEGEPLGLQIAFPVASCGTESSENYFANVYLEMGGSLQDSAVLTREVHSAAGKVLLLSGYSEEFEQLVYGSRPRLSNPNRISTAHPVPDFAGMRRTYVQVSDLHRFALKDLRDLARDYDGIHLYTNISRGTILVQDAKIEAQHLFAELNGLGLKFLYIDTCNSVQVVRSFRQTDIQALVAATENLYVNYAEEFELFFYESLGDGEYISVAFQKATRARGERDYLFTRSGQYDPMFLDLKADFRFGE
jgi:hypothetical protein